MSAIASIVDGKIVNQTTAEQKAEEAKKTAGGSLDKDAFLQLLVAQMKYQDPLEPTSNTEYISQLATFSSLEEMQNMSSSMEMSRASALVGQYVFMNVTSESGVTTYPEGTVDYVVYQNGKTYLSINETLYNMEDLDTVADPEYLLATRLHESFVTQLSKLPKVEQITKYDQAALQDIGQLISVYENMTTYQKSFLSESSLDAFQAYLEKYKELTKDESKTDGDEAGSDASNEPKTV